jgi:hypothetical protein
VRALRKIGNRAVTSVRLLLFFMAPSRFFLAPLVIVLLLAGLLLIASGGLKLVAPFAYTLF